MRGANRPTSTRTRSDPTNSCQIGGASQGIHWHVDPNHVVRYRADARRETRPKGEGDLARFDDPQLTLRGTCVLGAFVAHRREHHLLGADGLAALRAGELGLDVRVIRAARHAFSFPGPDARTSVSPTLIG